MKTRKILFSLSAFGMTLYSLWTIIWHMPFHQALWTEEIWTTYPMNILYWVSYQWLLFGSILLVLFAFLVKVDNSQPPTKLHKYTTLVFTFISLVSLIAAIYYSVYVCDSNYCFAPKVFRIIYTLFGTAWVWMLAVHPCGVSLSQSLRYLIGIGIGIIGLLFVLQLATGISYLLSGHFFRLNTCGLSSWLRYLLPAILLCAYCVLLFDKWHMPKLQGIDKLKGIKLKEGAIIPN